jgi:copper chaperone
MMLKLRVPEMSCGHCAATIEKAVKGIDPSAQVEVDLTTKVARIATTAQAHRIRESIRTAGYENQPTSD